MFGCYQKREGQVARMGWEMWASELSWASVFSHDLAQDASLESRAIFASEPNPGSQGEP